MVIDQEELPRCPLRPTLDNRASFAKLLEVYWWYKKGQMPDAGSYLDQAAAYTQFLGLFERAVADAKEIRDKAERARKK